MIQYTRNDQVAEKTRIEVTKGKGINRVYIFPALPDIDSARKFLGDEITLRSLTRTLREMGREITDLVAGENQDPQFRNAQLAKPDFDTRYQDELNRYTGSGGMTLAEIDAEITALQAEIHNARLAVAADPTNATVMMDFVSKVTAISDKITALNQKKEDRKRKKSDDSGE